MFSPAIIIIHPLRTCFTCMPAIMDTFVRPRLSLFLAFMSYLAYGINIWNPKIRCLPSLCVLYL